MILRRFFSFSDFWSFWKDRNIDLSINFKKYFVEVVNTFEVTKLLYENLKHSLKQVGIKL